MDCTHPRIVTARALLLLISAVVLSGGLTVVASPAHEVAAAPCDPPPAGNPIVCENQQPGNPQSEWDVSTRDGGDPSIQGFATDISYNKGTTVTFKINTTASAYTINIYRMGYYGGMGARNVARVTPPVSLPQTQPAGLTDATVGLIDCGHRAPSASWRISRTGLSGISFAKITRSDTLGASHIFFVVRDDASTSPLLYQTSDTTWQAYNSYGGASLYIDQQFHLTAGRAFKVSYNRPFNTRSTIG